LQLQAFVYKAATQSLRGAPDLYVSDKYPVHLCLRPDCTAGKLYPPNAHEVKRR